MTTVILACGRTKQKHPCMARDLYIGNYFRNALRWARSVTTEDRIYIISAKHGLIKTTRILAPYDRTITDPGAVTAANVADQARQLAITDPGPLFLGPRSYRQVLDPTFPQLHAPFDRFGRHGYQAQSMKRHFGKIPVTPDSESDFPSPNLPTS